MIRHIQNGMAVIVFLVTAMMMASAAHADDLWQVDSQSGDVRVAVEGVTLVSLGDARTLPAGTRISTGSTGRMVLRRGDEAIVVAPNTSIELAPESRQGLATTIIQSIGTILLSVDKKEQQHFEVETPYLAAVVKGTKFAVTVADGKSSVHVVQGAVEVLDFASGSGLAAIAAMMAGARSALAVDIDPLAETAALMNAVENGVVLETSTADMVGQSLEDFDLILAGDICYEQSVAERVHGWLQREAALGREVLIGDPGRTFLPRGALEQVTAYGVKSARDLDDTDVRNACVWRFTGA